MPSFFKVTNIISELKISRKNSKEKQQQQQQAQQQQAQQQQAQQQPQQQQQQQPQSPQYQPQHYNPQQPFLPPQQFSPTFPHQFSPTFAPQQFSPSFAQQQFAPSPTWQQPPLPNQQQQQQYSPPPNQPQQALLPPPQSPQHNPHVYIPHQQPPAPTDLPPAYTQQPASRPKSSGELVRPKSRGSIRASLKRIGSKASLRRKGSSSANSSTVEVNNAGLTQQNSPPPLPLDARTLSQDIQRQDGPSNGVELTPPPSGGKSSHTQMTLPPQPATQTPNSDQFDSDDDLYSDPCRANATSPNKTGSPQRTALPSLNTDVPPPAPMPPQDGFQQIPDQLLQQQQEQYLQQQLLQQTQQYHNAPLANPLFFVRSVLDTIPASPATTLASPVSPVTNPFRKSSLATHMEGGNGSSKPSSPLIGCETVDPDDEEPAQVAVTKETTVTVEAVPETPIQASGSGRESPKLSLQTDVPTAPKEMSPKSPETATRMMMQGIKVAFLPPPKQEPIPEPEPQPSPVRLADNNPFKSLCDDESASNSRRNSIGRDLSDSRRNSLTALGIKAIVPPAAIAQPPVSIPPPPAGQIMGVRAAAAAKAAAAAAAAGVPDNGEGSSRPASSSNRTPPPVPPRTPQNGKPLPKFKRAPEAKTPAKLPEGFVPPPPPPMQLPKGWTAQWDEKEGKYAYYHGTRGRDKQYEMPTEEYKKMSIKEKRAGKKKAVAAAVSNLGLYQETASPSSPTGPQISPLLPTPPTSAARTGGMAGLLPSPMVDPTPSPSVVEVGGSAD